MAVWQTKVSSLYCPCNSAPIKTLFLVIKAQTGLYLVPWFTLQHTISTIMSPFLPIFSAVWGLKRSRLSFCWTDSEVFSVVYPAEFCFCLSALLYVEVVVTFSLKFFTEWLCTELWRWFHFMVNVRDGNKFYILERRQSSPALLSLGVCDSPVSFTLSSSPCKGRIQCKQNRIDNWLDEWNKNIRWLAATVF